MNTSPYELSPIKNQSNLSQSIGIPAVSRLLMRKQKQIQETKMYHNMALESFPFGKQGIKISNYVSSKMNSKEQEDNARILQEFRRKAIEDKFHNKHGSLRNSRVINRYITESMMPGVTLNPSMVNTLEPELKSYQQQQNINQNLYLSQVPTRQHTQPTYDTIDQLYNTRRKVSLPDYGQYSNNMRHQTLSYTNSPQRHQRKKTTQSQTQVSQIKSYHELDLQRKYYKLRCKYSKKALGSFDKVERLLHSLKKEIKQNSKYLQNVIIENHSKICAGTDVKFKRGKSFSVQQGGLKKQVSIIDGKQLTKNSKRGKLKTQLFQAQSQLSEETGSEQEQGQENQQNKKAPNWKLNQKILYNSTQSSIGNNYNDQKTKKKKPKPKVQYTSSLSESRNDDIKASFFTEGIRKTHDINYEMTRDYKMKQSNNDNRHSEQVGIEKIRKHLRLLKKHSNRLQTIHSHQLVH